MWYHCLSVSLLLLCITGSEESHVGSSLREASARGRGLKLPADSHVSDLGSAPTSPPGQDLRVYSPGRETPSQDTLGS